MQVYDATETASLLPYGALAEAMGEVLRAKKLGRVHAPQRVHMPLGGSGTLLLMPAADDAVAVTKIVSVHPENAASRLPCVQGEVLVMRTADGERLGLLDGRVLTQRRTAAISLFAAQKLMPRGNDAAEMLVFGAGAQAHGHVEAFVREMGVRRVRIVSRSGVTARNMADWAGRELQVDARAVENTPEALDAAMQTAEIVITATTSGEPVFSEEQAALLRGNVFIAAVGAFTPAMAELPETLMRRGRVFVDTLEGALHEAGDVIRAGLTPQDVTPLEDVLDGERPEPENGRPVICKSVGHALFDLAAARLACA